MIWKIRSAHEDFFYCFVGMTRKGKKVKSEDMYYKLKCAALTAILDGVRAAL